MPTPLPAVLSIDNATELWSSAYADCVAYETASLGMGATEGWTDLIAARMLGYLVIHAPTATGRDNVSNEIKDCLRDPGKLNQLATKYKDCFICCFRRVKGPTPVPSEHPSRPSFDSEREMLDYLLNEAPKDHTTAKKKALIRDGHKCMLTGIYDASMSVTFPAARVVVANFAHILPASTDFDISGEDEAGLKYDYAHGVWAVMHRFGDVSVPDELNGSDIHRLENGLTLDLNIHSFFDTLNLWLEETGTPNQYRPAATRPGLLYGIPTIVTFTSHGSQPLPLPDPKYLALHAACAKVAHLSGVGECIDKIFHDLEETKVLAEDGASILALHTALLVSAGGIVTGPS